MKSGPGIFLGFFSWKDLSFSKQPRIIIFIFGAKQTILGKEFLGGGILALHIFFGEVAESRSDVGFDFWHWRPETCPHDMDLTDYCKICVKVNFVDYQFTAIILSIGATSTLNTKYY